MTEDADTQPAVSPPTIPSDDDRYAAVDIDSDETIIYDREIEDAWIQSDATTSLQEFA